MRTRALRQTGRTVLTLLPLAWLLLTTALPAHSAPVPNAADGITVGATVRAYARIEEIETAKNLRITTADVKRGWVDVRTSTHVKVKTNGPRGYHLHIKIESADIWLTEIRGLADHPAFGPKGGRVLRRTSGPTTETLDLAFRFHLAEDAKPGTIAWPVDLSVRPR